MLRRLYDWWRRLTRRAEPPPLLRVHPGTAEHPRLWMGKRDTIEMLQPHMQEYANDLNAWLMSQMARELGGINVSEVPAAARAHLVARLGPSAASVIEIQVHTSPDDPGHVRLRLLVPAYLLLQLTLAWLADLKAAGHEIV